MNIHSMLKFDTMAVDIESIRQLPKVSSVDWLKPGQVISNMGYETLFELLNSRKQLTLIGKNGCAIITSIQKEILIIQSQPNVNLGSIDLILDSIRTSL
tara:strand:- start:414 stop:710 length:297 start_codon:yes stop_codon:yes gene_type:complete